MPVRAVCKPHSPDLKRGALATDARGCSLWRSLLERPPPAPESRVRDPLVGELVRTRVGGGYIWNELPIDNGRSQWCGKCCSLCFISYTGSVCTFEAVSSLLCKVPNHLSIIVFLMPLWNVLNSVKNDVHTIVMKSKYQYIELTFYGQSKKKYMLVELLLWNDLILSILVQIHR